MSIMKRNISVLLRFAFVVTVCLFCLLSCKNAQGVREYRSGAYKYTVENEEVTITHRWSNLGYAYCPTNINAWKNIYKVAFALLDPQTEEPVAIYVDEDAHPHEWIKGKPVKNTFKTEINDVQPGEYVWAVGIIDVKCNNKIGIHISAKRNVASNGWLKLFNVQIN